MKTRRTVQEEVLERVFDTQSEDEQRDNEILSRQSGLHRRDVVYRRAALIAREFKCRMTFHPLGKKKRSLFSHFSD